MTAPVKGTTFTLPGKLDYNSKPVVFTVTSVTNFKGQPHVYVRDAYYHKSRLSMPRWEKLLERAQDVTTPAAKPAGPRKYYAENDARSLFAAGQRAGWLAAQAVVPVPMVVQGYESQPVMGGVCGFAWVRIRPATSSLARRLLDMGLARRDTYRGGILISVSDYGQSMERKAAHAAAMAEVFQKAGIDAEAESRMD